MLGPQGHPSGREAPLSLPPLPELPPNPIYETNAELAEVSKLTRQLVDIEQRQAEHIHSLAETSNLPCRNPPPREK
jgi:hypothetical protein